MYPCDQHISAYPANPWPSGGDITRSARYARPLVGRGAWRAAESLAGHRNDGRVTPELHGVQRLKP
jgi:hypothetical protein